MSELLLYNSGLYEVEPVRGGLVSRGAARMAARVGWWRASFVARQVLATPVDESPGRFALFLGVVGGFYAVAGIPIWPVWLGVSLQLLGAVGVAWLVFYGARVWFASYRVKCWWVSDSRRARRRALLAAAVVAQRVHPFAKRDLLGVMPPLGTDLDWVDDALRLFLRDSPRSQPWSGVRRRAVLFADALLTSTAREAFLVLQGARLTEFSLDAPFRFMLRFDAALSGDPVLGRLALGLSDGWVGSLDDLLEATRALA